MEIPANPAIKSGETVFFGGIAPINTNGSIVGRNDVQHQAKVIIDRMASYLEKADMTLKNLVFVAVYLQDIGLYPSMNEAYSRFMPKPFPTRKVIETTLTLDGMLVEMSGIAVKGNRIFL